MKKTKTDTYIKIEKINMIGLWNDRLFLRIERSLCDSQSHVLNVSLDQFCCKRIRKAQYKTKQQPPQCVRVCVIVSVVPSQEYSRAQ
jgi:hypothetical protein